MATKEIYKKWSYSAMLSFYAAVSVPRGTSIFFFLCLTIASLLLTVVLVLLITVIQIQIKLSLSII